MKPSPSTPWARGLLPASWERGSPGLPPAAHGVARLAGVHGPSTSTQAQDPREGPTLAGQMMQSFLRGSLTRQAREEVERSRQGVPRVVPMTQAMKIKTRRAPARIVSLFPLWCKGGKRRHGVPRHQDNVSISVQQDQDQQDGRMEVTVEPKTVSSPAPLAGKDHL